MPSTFTPGAAWKVQNVWAALLFPPTTETDQTQQAEDRQRQSARLGNDSPVQNDRVETCLLELSTAGAVSVLCVEPDVDVAGVRGSVGHQLVCEGRTCAGVL